MRAAGRVAIGLCTAHRPEMLRCCLAALASQIVPEGFEITIIVADNEAESNNHQEVDEFAASCSFPVKYVHEPRRGISRARNAVLDACEDRFDWIAFTDDDCAPAPDWISALIEAAARHGADVVYGRREWTPPRRPPFWFAPEKPTRRTEGQRLQVAATHNVLMAGEVAGLRFRGRRVGLRFDERLAHGEDTDFFWCATTRFGARIVYSDAAVVHETIPPHRATMRYQMMRRFHRDAAPFYFERRYMSLGRAVLKCARRIPVTRPSQHQPTGRGASPGTVWSGAVQADRGHQRGQDRRHGRRSRGARRFQRQPLPQGRTGGIEMNPRAFTLV